MNFDRVSVPSAILILLLLSAEPGWAEEPLFPVRNQVRWGFVSRAGELEIPFRFERARPFSEGLAAVRMAGLWGFIDLAGEMVIKPQFDEVEGFSEGLSLVRLCDRYGYIDHSGHYVINPFYGQAVPFAQGLAFVAGDDGPYLIDREERVQITGFDEVALFSEGMAPARPDGESRWGYIDPAGKLVIGARFRFAQPFSDGLALVRDRKGYGWIDRQGKVVLRQGRYRVGEANSAFANGLAAVRVEDRWGYIDKQGRLAIPAVYAWAEPFHHDLARVYSDEALCYIDREGKQIWPRPD